MIVRFGTQRFSSVRRESGEGRAFLGQLFGDFVAQQPAKPRRDFGQLRGRLRRNRFPAKKVIKAGNEFERSSEFSARSCYIALEFDDRADEFAVLLKTERVAIGVEQVG